MAAVGELCYTPLVVPHTLTVDEVARIMVKKDRSSVLISVDGEIKGIVTERDIIRRVVAAGKNPSEVTIYSIMSKPLITIDSSLDPAKATDIMSKYNIRRVVVKKDDKIIGIFTARQFVKNWHRIFRRTEYDRRIYMR